MDNCPSCPAARRAQAHLQRPWVFAELAYEFEIFLGRQRGHEVVGLEDEAYGVAAVHGKRFFIGIGVVHASKRKLPPVSLSIPPIMLSIVLLPQPDSPRITRNSPSRTSRFTPLRIWICVSPWPKTLVTPRREMMDFFSSAKPRFRPLSSMDGREHGQILAEVHVRVVVERAVLLVNYLDAADDLIFIDERRADHALCDKPVLSSKRPAQRASLWQSLTTVVLPSLTTWPAMPSPSARLIPVRSRRQW